MKPKSTTTTTTTSKAPTFTAPPPRGQLRGKPYGPETAKQEAWRRFQNGLHELRSVAILIRKSVDYGRRSGSLDQATIEYAAKVVDSLYIGLHNTHIALTFLPDFVSGDPGVQDGHLTCCSEVTVASTAAAD